MRVAVFLSVVLLCSIPDLWAQDSQTITNGQNPADSLFQTDQAAQDLPQDQSAATPLSPAVGNQNSDSVQDEQNPADALFQAGPQDLTTQDNASGNPADTLLQSFVQSPGIKLTGTFSGKAAFVGGWKDTPDFTDLSKSLDFSAYMSMYSAIILDARPDSTFRFHGLVSTDFPAASGGFAWRGLSIEELFVDYTLLDTVFFRVGRYGLTWGQGRIFTPGDLVSNVDTSVAAKAYVPIGPDGLTAIAWGGSGDRGWRDLNYAALGELVLGPVDFGLSGRYIYGETQKIVLNAKTSIKEVDLIAEGVLDVPSNAGVDMEVLAGFYWQHSSPDVRVYGEYYFNGSTVGLNDHSLGLAAAWNNIGGTHLKVGIQWIHTFFDMSGRFTPVLEIPIVKHLSLDVAIQLSYGADGSRYVSDTPDPGNRRVALILQGNFSGSF